VFDKPQGAGGHISKAHPNASKIYKAKMETREARAPQRALLEQTKNLLLDRNPDFDIKGNRTILNSLKNTLIK
jgi:hypothetical protein|tara:strand:+ start:346 stop:564 length:219 start_codon:yes stop_codon:yes gene_type:complete